jgi:hypothetical protein
LVFDEAPVGVILAVLVASVATQEEAHDRSGYRRGRGWEGVGSALQGRFDSKRMDLLGFRAGLLEKISGNRAQLRKSG